MTTTKHCVIITFTSNTLIERYAAVRLENVRTQLVESLSLFPSFIFSYIYVYTAPIPSVLFLYLFLLLVFFISVHRFWEKFGGTLDFIRTTVFAFCVSAFCCSLFFAPVSKVSFHYTCGDQDKIPISTKGIQKGRSVSLPTMEENIYVQWWWCCYCYRATWTDFMLRCRFLNRTRRNDASVMFGIALCGSMVDF